MNRPIAFICPNVPNKDGKLLWIEKLFPEKVNSWPAWTHVIEAHAVYGQEITSEDIIKLKYHHEIVVIIANPIKSPFIKKMILKLKDLKKKIVLLLDGHIELFFDRVWGWDFYWCLNHCNLVATNRMDSTDYVRALTNKPVEWLSFPVDIQHFSQYQQDADRGKIIVCAGSGCLDAIMILHRAFPELRFTLTERGGFFKREQLEYLGMFEYVDLVPKVNQQEFYKRVSEHFCGVYLDYKGHLGRFPTDCAILGIPCIGTIKTDRQGWLFPELTIQKFGDAYKINEMLINLRIKPNYKEIVNRAQKRVQLFGQQSSLERWQKVCKEHLNGNN